MNPLTRIILALIPDSGCRIKELRASPLLKKYELGEVDAAMLGLRESGQIRLLMGDITKPCAAAMPAAPKPREEQLREASRLYAKTHRAERNTAQQELRSRHAGA